jgi:hypothetical protein
MLPDKSTQLKPRVQSWDPDKLLPSYWYNHPLDKGCKSCELRDIMSICSLRQSSTFVRVPSRTQDKVSVGELWSLVCHNSEINQQIINTYTHLLCSQFKISVLDSSFFSLLKTSGWNRVASWFSLTVNLTIAPH